MATDRKSKAPPSSRRGDPLARTTAKPPFDPDDFARDSESLMAAVPFTSDAFAVESAFDAESGTVALPKSASEHPTNPPDSSYQALKESCGTIKAARPARMPREIVDEESHRKATRAFVTPLAAVPTLIVADADREWFDLAADAQRFMDSIDGQTTLARLAEQCGMAPSRALEVVAQLVNEHIIELRSK
jgi:hypothetical protein